MPRHRSLRSRLRSYREKVLRWFGRFSRRQLALIAGIGVAALWLGWTILAAGIAESRSETLPEVALDWQPLNPEALVKRAEDTFAKATAGEEVGAEDLAAAKHDALRAAAAAPLDVRAISLLGRIAEKEGDIEKARQLMELAGRRDLRHWPTQAWLVNELYREGKREDVVYRSDALLKAYAQAREQLLPILMAYASDPETRPILVPTLAEGPGWREWFLGEVSKQSSEVAEKLFDDLREAEVPPTIRERRAYLLGLVSQGQVVKAYLGWVQMLSPEERTRIGTPFNGGFEDEPSGLPFDWTIERVAGAATEIKPSGDGKAVMVEFAHQRIAYRHLSQIILLGPGRYRLSGKVKGEAIDNLHGLYWRIYCSGQPQPLVDTEKFKGTFAWREFNSAFQVPEEGCRAQMLRLEIGTRIVLEQTIGGRIWFDDLIVRRQPDESG